MKAFFFYAVHVALLGGAAWAWRRWPERLPRSRLAVALNVLGLGLLTFVISEPRTRWQDFTDAYYTGGVAALQGRAAVLALLNDGVHGFVNVPVVAYFFAPFGLLPAGAAAFSFALLGGVAAYVGFRACAQAARLPAREAQLFAIVFALNGPLANSLREGNTTHFALLALACAMLLLRAGREFAAGACIGVAAIFKLPLLIFGAYFVLRGRWRAALAGGLVLAAVSGVSLALFGVDAHVSWYRSFVAGAGDQPLGAFNVQSVAALIARVERGGGALGDWTGHPLSPVGALLSKLITGAAALGAAVVCAWSGRTSPASAESPTRQRELEYQVVLVLACVLSPLAWSHYFALLLLPIAFLLSPEFPLPRTGATRFVIGVAVVSLSLPVLRPPPFFGGSGAVASLARLGVSHFVFGEFLLLTLLLYACVKQRRQQVAQPTT